jgi:DNA repair protein RadD
MKLRPYQEEALQAVKQSLKAGLSPIVEIPTGGGKSIVIAKLAEWVASFDNCRVLIVTHRKELVKQNAAKINADVGVYSAGLDSRDTENQVIVAGVQSVYNKDLGDFKLIIHDECHLLPHNKESMYQQLYDKYPNARKVGFSATPYRTDSDDLPVYDHICYQISVKDLVDQGYLCPLTSKISKLQYDTTSVDIVMGDYVKSQLSDILLDEDLLRDTIAQLIPHLKYRRSCLIFCVNVAHAEIVASLLRQNYINAAAVHSKMPKDERDTEINLFIKDQTHVLTNCDILTIGFDAPNIDMLVMLRPTESRGLYVQMCGRGTRLHPDKKDCLVLDFAGNINRHGPITNLIPREKKLKRDQSSEGYTHKTCPVCETIWPINTRECEECGNVFSEPRVISHDNVPSDIDILGDGGKWYGVAAIYYSKHEKNDKPASLKVTYITTSDEFCMWYACNSTSAWARNKANQWIMQNCLNYDGRLDLDNLDRYLWREPTRIRVVSEGKYKRVSAYAFEADTRI